MDFEKNENQNSHSNGNHRLATVSMKQALTFNWTNKSESFMTKIKQECGYCGKTINA